MRGWLMLVLAFGVVGAVRGDDWPQWLGPQRDGVWRETGILEKFPKGGPTVKWRVPIGSGYAGPAVAGGRVYITDRILAKGTTNPTGAGAFRRSRLAGSERVLCLDEATGKEVWKHEYPCEYAISYPAGPRCTPVVRDGKVWTLGAMGDLLCLDADSGKVIWSKNLPKDYRTTPAVWGFAAHPLLDGDRLICLVGGAGSAAVAFHKDTGKEIWRALTATPDIGYSPPTLIEAGGTRQLIIWHPASVNSLDPETGKVYWSEPFRANASLTVAMPRQAGDLLYLTSFYSGSLMLKLAADRPAATVLWKSKTFEGGQGREQPRNTDGIQSIMPTPFIQGGHIYGICSYGELRCVNAATNERLWMTLKATGNAVKPEERWGNAFLVAQGDRFFLFNEKGDLIIARLTPQGYEEIDRAHLLEPDNHMPGRPVVWSHPAFANRCIYVRNDHEIICASLAAGL
jgi:outer membrane protein assembly factor BamB